jgi:hypothetical protein
MRRMFQPRRRRMVLATTLVLAVGLVIGGVSIAANRGDGHGIQKQIVLRFLDVEDKFEFIDLGEPAKGEEDLGPGDMFVAEDILRNRADTKTLGTLAAKCTNLVTPGLVHCEATAILSSGTIEFAGTIDFAEEPTGPLFVAVTGGTERFENVVGEAKLGDEVRPGATVFTVELIPSFRRP